MRKSKNYALILGILLSAGCLSSCGGSSVRVQPGEKIWTDKIFYDSSLETPEQVSVRLESDSKVESIRISMHTYTKGFGFKNNVLTLSSEIMGEQYVSDSTDDQMIVSFKDGSTKRVPIMICTKIITTAEEFQAINDDLDGVYALGNDIDLSSIDNFEPLGYFFDSETNVDNHYFHGILEGNGYTIKNANVLWSSSKKGYSSSDGFYVWDSVDVYNDGSLFESEAHTAGNNIGLFQIIGSAGVVRNVNFSNIRVRGRTIVGVIAGNNSGTIENCKVLSDCAVEGGTHFYDNDCNIAGVVGINAASGTIVNTVSYVSDISFPDVFIDYSDEYKGQIGNGWDHTASPGNTDPSWKYANVDRPLMQYGVDGSITDTGKKESDSNGSLSNGIYAFVGKNWGTVTSSYAKAFNLTPYEGSSREVQFGQTHLGAVKPGSGESDMGDFSSCAVYSESDLKSAALYASYDTTCWNIAEGNEPTLKCPVYGFETAE